ncbi:FAD-binding oxidoreductase [Herbiconiux sp. SYSU D00978]|uniref:FAD-binding oxidoreductase n=1 Tax=Herbiconiux sp. SYSU D00978 TaxID=2812562 RepID=UPI0027DD87F1|nr:FAD-binding oxidoreductase [Herbiconiux sp. SYSU D00978]
MTGTRTETPSARSITLDVPGWGGNLAGQHLDLRLTAEDGYQAVRSYSVASAGPGDTVELAVDRIDTGEVSPYLVDELLPGDQVELRGPLGGWFVWKPETSAPAVQLIAGGSGVVPLLAMARAHAASGSIADMRLLYSVRTPDDVFFRDELQRLGVDVTFVHTRRAPDGASRPAGRVTRELLAELVHPASVDPDVFVCGPTGFVESVATWLVDLGFRPERVKTERFGGL